MERNVCFAFIHFSLLCPNTFFMLWTVLFVELLAVAVLRHLSLEYCMNLNNNILHDFVKWIVFSKCLPHLSTLFPSFDTSIWQLQYNQNFNLHFIFVNGNKAVNTVLQNFNMQEVNLKNKWDFWVTDYLFIYIYIYSLPSSVACNRLK